MSLKERTKQAMAYAGIESNAELARRLTRLLGRDIPPQSIHVIVSGHVSISKHTPYIAQVCGVSSFWLATGEGSMLAADGVAESGAQYRAYGPELREIADLLKRVNALAASLRKDPKLSAEAAKLLEDLADKRRAKRSASTPTRKRRPKR